MKFEEYDQQFSILKQRIVESVQPVARYLGAIATQTKDRKRRRLIKAGARHAKKALVIIEQAHLASSRGYQPVLTTKDAVLPSREPGYRGTYEKDLEPAPNQQPEGSLPNEQ